MDLLYLKGNHKLWLLSRPRSRACLESYLEGKKHILKKQNPNFVFSKKKKAWFVKILALKNYFLEMKQETWLKNGLPNSLACFSYIFNTESLKVRINKNLQIVTNNTF